MVQQNKQEQKTGTLFQQNLPRQREKKNGKNRKKKSESPMQVSFSVTEIV